MSGEVTQTEEGVVKLASKSGYSASTSGVQSSGEHSLRTTTNISVQTRQKSDTLLAASVTQKVSKCVPDPAKKGSKKAVLSPLSVKPVEPKKNSPGKLFNSFSIKT